MGFSFHDQKIQNLVLEKNRCGFSEPKGVGVSRFLLRERAILQVKYLEVRVFYTFFVFFFFSSAYPKSFLLSETLVSGLLVIAVIIQLFAVQS